MFLFKLAGDHEALAKYEAEKLNQCELTKINTQYYTSPNNTTDNLALTRKIFEIIQHGNKPSIVLELQRIKFKNKNKTFKLIKAGDHFLKTKEIADILQTKQKVNLNNPDEIYYCIFIDNHYYFCKLLWENKDDYNKRKAHNRPKLHPSSMHPKIAKAMVNIAISEEICDPFCGSGGILIESCLLHKKTLGIDIKQSMLDMAKENLNFFNCKNYKLKKENALDYNDKIKTIVTDVPYGKNTTLSNNLYKELLATYSNKINKMIIAFPANAKIKSFLKNWEIEYIYEYILNKNLNKKIYVLNKKL